MPILPTNHLLYTLTVDVRYFVASESATLDTHAHSKRCVAAFDRNVMQQVTHCQLFSMYPGCMSTVSMQQSWPCKQ